MFKRRTTRTAFASAAILVSMTSALMGLASGAGAEPVRANEAAQDCSLLPALKGIETVKEPAELERRYTEESVAKFMTNKLELVSRATYDLNQRKAGQEERDRVLAALCLTPPRSAAPVEGASLAPSSVPGNMYAHPPYVYWDSNTSMMVGVAYFGWYSSQPYLDEVSCGIFGQGCPISQPNGGIDGVAFRIPTPIWLSPYQALASNGNGSACYGWVNEYSSLGKSISQFGIAYTKQDQVSKVVCHDSNMHSTQITSYFVVYNHNQWFQMFSDYEHTWQNTVITGFGVGQYEFSVQWNTNQNHWSQGAASTQMYWNA